MTRCAVALAPAKINIGLEVVGRRADGLHEIVSILQTVSLYDRLEWQESGFAFLYESPAGIVSGDDLVRTSLNLARDRESWTGNLGLRKSIPVAAGLGGGSSDAAIALNLSFPEFKRESLAAIASQVGTDVPFFVEGGTALATGTGTHLERLPDLVSWSVIVTPRIVIRDKTRSLYASLTVEDYSDGKTVRELARGIPHTNDIHQGPPNAFTRHLMEYRDVRAARDALMLAGARWVSISGAGPSMYTMLGNYQSARSIANRVPPGAGEIFVVRTLPRRSSRIDAENLATRMRGNQDTR